LLLMATFSEDYYKILQIDPAAETEVVQAAYKRLALKYHPDTSRSGDATRRMQELNEAYETLSDPVKRADYDRQRKEQQQHSTPSRTGNDWQQSHAEAVRQRTQQDAQRRAAKEAQRRAEAEGLRKEKEEARQRAESERQKREQERVKHELKKRQRSRIIWSIVAIGGLVVIWIIVSSSSQGNSQAAAIDNVQSSLTDSSIGHADIGLEPVDVAKNVMQAVEEDRYDRVADLVCAAHRKEIIKSLDFGTIFAAKLGSTIDRRVFLDALTPKLSNIRFEELRRSDNEVVLRVKGRFEFQISDREKLKIVIATMLRSQGSSNVEQSTIDQVTDSFIKDPPPLGVDFDYETSVIKENGRWLYCQQPPYD
jgi:flagellar biosynthesis GTPase FlhF